jgi:hypothetical protein
MSGRHLLRQFFGKLVAARLEESLNLVSLNEVAL